MKMVCTCCGHWQVEQIVLNGRPMLRVKGHGYTVATVATIEEVDKVLADHRIDIATLVPAP